MLDANDKFLRRRMEFAVTLLRADPDSSRAHEILREVPRDKWPLAAEMLLEEAWLHGVRIKTMWVDYELWIRDYKSVFSPPGQ